MKSTYLCGPMGSHDKDTENYRWRVIAQQELSPKIQVLNPYRDYERLSESQSNECIMMRDYFDVLRADLLLLGWPQPGISLGTTIELAWAFHLRKPVIGWGKENAKLDEHPMLSQVPVIWADDLNGAIDLVESFLGV